MDQLAARIRRRASPTSPTFVDRSRRAGSQPGDRREDERNGHAISARTASAEHSIARTQIADDLQQVIECAPRHQRTAAEQMVDKLSDAEEQLDRSATAARRIAATNRSSRTQTRHNATPEQLKALNRQQQERAQRNRETGPAARSAPSRRRQPKHAERGESARQSEAERETAAQNASDPAQATRFKKPRRISTTPPNNWPSAGSKPKTILRWNSFAAFKPNLPRWSSGRRKSSTKR